MALDRDAPDVVITDLDASDGWEPCLRSLRLSGHDLRVSVIVPKPGRADDLRVVAPEINEVVAATSAAGLWALRAATLPDNRSVIVITRPVIVPPGFLDNAVEIIAGDLRVATVGFLTNDADYLSFPHRNTPISHQVENLDEVSITRRLRERGPVLRPTSVPVAVGALTVLAGPALGALGVLPEAETGAHLVAAVSLAAQRKGFVSVVDPATFYTTPRDTGRVLEATGLEVVEGPGSGGASLVEHGGPIDLGNVGTLLAQDRVSHTSPFAIAHRVARAKTLGLRVGIDGSCLGPTIMGTQVQTLAIIEALAAHDQVAQIIVAIPHAVPPYAMDAFSAHKVQAVIGSDEDVSGMTVVDVLHRPFQPQRRIDVNAWRAVAHRTAVSILDLIAFRNGAYHASGPDWMGYRAAVDTTLAAVDGVTVISADVKQQILDERLPIEAERIFVAELGIDHVSEGMVERPPAELIERGFLSEEFVFVLGASYAHKNRDQAIRAVQVLRERGRDLGLVMVGAAVPHGSSRQHEAVALGSDHAEWLWTVPDVANEERNWLLRHASAVLYPTSAEGFGFVPFEAAQLGTPTLSVPFGPLVELSPDLPVEVEGWDAIQLAGAVERVLADPGLARAQVAEVLKAGSRLTWAQTAEKLVAFYGELLAAPSR